MPEYGYHLSAEEHAPPDLVRNARRAEEEGFGYALVSDHFHPWLDEQGHSGFVWNVVGAIAATTERLGLGTGVTCPLIRIHPAIVAQAAATSGELIACGPDPEPVLEQMKDFERAGYDHLYLHQVGPDQEGFFRFWREQLKPRL